MIDAIVIIKDFIGKGTRGQNIFRFRRVIVLSRFTTQHPHYGRSSTVAHVGGGHHFFLIAFHGLVNKFDNHREANCSIQVTFRNMETEAFDHQREADHHQEAQTQNHHGRMSVDEIHQSFGCPEHNPDGNNHGNHHH